MTLSEYVESMKRELDEFRRRYMEEHVKAPDQWSLEMSPGDWDEQVICLMEDSDECE